MAGNFFGFYTFVHIFGLGEESQSLQIQTDLAR